MDARLIATSYTCPITVNEDESSTTKRKADAEKYKKHSIIPNEEVQWGELDNDVIQKILARLPVASLFRFLSVCRGWNFLFWSPGFHTLCREVPRKPWFYMLCAKSPAGVVYDTEALVWRHINLPAPTRGPGGATRRYQIPVAASDGLVCFRSTITELTVCNLITGSTRLLPVLKPGIPVLAIAMRVIGSSYQIVIAVGRAPSYGVKVFTSMENSWKEMPITGTYEFASNQTAEDESRAARLLYRREILERIEYLKGEGIILRNPTKRLSGVITVYRNGHQVIHFLNLNGRVVAFNIHDGTMCMYPHILPPQVEYSVDLVECGGRVLLVVLVEMMESASLRVWEFDWGEGEWKQLMAMPPAMSNAYYHKKADINCIGYGDLIMVCISSRQFHQVVMCNIANGTWVELPKCYAPGTRTLKRFVSAYCFEPRIEACV